jgi:L-threonylcarbamoyladenylate synthase
MPTETVYGLAARFDVLDGINSIFRLKQRPSFDPLIIHIANLDQVHLLSNQWSETAESLAKSFWPGPLTLVVPKHPNVSSLITAGLETVGIRMPNHPIALELIREAMAPLAAPSANRFGRTSPTTAEHVRTEFPLAIASGEILVLDGGESLIGVESTVCLVEANHVQVLRPGGITIEELQRHFTTHESSALRSVIVSMTESHHASPGHTEHHYETKKPLILSWGPELGHNAAAYDVEKKTIRVDRIKEVKLSDDPGLAARMLYASLREADQLTDSDAIFIRRDLSVQSAGLWVAIDDRLKRASRLQLK